MGLPETLRVGRALDKLGGVAWQTKKARLKARIRDMADRLMHLFGSLGNLGTTVVVATHDLHLLTRVPHAQMMQLDAGRLLDPTGVLRNPPRVPA